MKLVSYTITLKQLLDDLTRLREDYIILAKNSLDENNLKKAIKWLQKADERFEDFSLEKQIDAWLCSEIFADEIFQKNPDVSDILLIISVKDGDYIEKHWLCNKDYKIN